MREQDHSGQARREPWRLIPFVGVMQLINTLLFLIFAVAPFHFLTWGNAPVRDAASYGIYSSPPFGALMLAGAGFAVSFGWLLGLALLATLVMLIPLGLRTLAPSERVMWLATLATGVLTYLLTWQQFYSIQRWVLA
jgi:hypothetical protein